MSSSKYYRGGKGDAFMNRPPNLHIVSEASRFHAERADNSMEVNVKGVSISIGSKDLLVDGHLQLSFGAHYGLIGRNGVGKSFLLKAIGYGWIPGLKHMKAMYVEQLERKEQLESKVIDMVVHANPEEAAIYADIERLENCIDKETKEMEAVWLDMKRQDTREQLELAKMDAIKTSGARGSEARKRVIEIENQLAKISLSESEQPIQVTIQQHLQHLYSLVEDKETQYAKAEKILNSFGFTEEKQQCTVGELSGGWRIRVALAMAVFVEPMVLLLDEPTNHLDLPAICWLTKYIKNLDDVTVVIVSHDRNFLNETVDEIILFQGQKLSYHTGNYDQYMETQAEQKEHRAKMREALDKKKSAMESSIEAGIRQAKKSSDDKRLAQMASKKKKLVERVGMERNEKGHRFKLNRDRIGYYTSVRDDVADEHHDATLNFKLPEPGLLTQRGSLVEVEDIFFTYSRPSNEYVLERVTINFEQGCRIAFVGANGQGKTTLMDILTGNKKPSRGLVRTHPQAKFGYFAQHFVDGLQSCDESSLEYLARLYPNKKEQDLYSQLGAFGLGGIARTPLSSLSGGQRVRFAFAHLAIESPQALFLDEPTNHLDLDAIESLAEGLEAFQGAVIFVSHDMYFVKRIAKTIYLVHDRSVKPLENIDKWYKKQSKISPV